MRRITELDANGYTLMEVIVAFVIISVVGAALFSILGTSMTRSSEPLFREQEAFELQRVMENFVTAYEKYYAGDLPGLKEFIGAEGTSRQIEGDHYDVVENHYIKFVSNQDEAASPADPLNLLKVTIKNGNNETLTYIFVG